MVSPLHGVHYLNEPALDDDEDREGRRIARYLVIAQMASYESDYARMNGC
jgi:hypothetical protein